MNAYKKGRRVQTSARPIASPLSGAFVPASPGHPSRTDRPGPRASWMVRIAHASIGHLELYPERAFRLQHLGLPIAVAGHCGKQNLRYGDPERIPLAFESGSL